MPGLGKEGVEHKAGGGKVAGRKQTRKPGIYRFETAMGKMSDCQDRDPQLIPQVSIAAHAEGLDGLVGTTVSEKANDEKANYVLLFQPQPTANLTGVRMMDQSKSVAVRPSETRGFFRFTPRPRKGKKKNKAGRHAWARRGEQRWLV